MHAQVYKGMLDKTRAVAVRTIIHMASEAGVIQLNVVSLCKAFLASIQCQEAPETNQIK